jgi:hypothetical protein
VSAHAYPTGRYPLGDEHKRSTVIGEAADTLWNKYKRPPTVAELSRYLGWAPLAVAEAVGGHGWLFLDGDVSSPETAIVESEGE